MAVQRETLIECQKIPRTNQTFDGMSKRKSVQNCIKEYLANDDSHEVESLLETTTNCDIQDKEGKTLLMAAAMKGNTNLVQKLVQKGAAVNVRDNTKRSALFYATKCGYSETVEYLLINGARASVNKTDKNSDTPLHVACQRRYCSCVGVLLKYGADRNAYNVKGESPASIARSRGNKCLEQMLSDQKSEENQDVQSRNFHVCNRQRFKRPTYEVIEDFEDDKMDTEEVLSAGVKKKHSNSIGMSDRVFLPLKTQDMSFEPQYLDLNQSNDEAQIHHTKQNYPTGLTRDSHPNWDPYEIETTEAEQFHNDSITADNMASNHYDSAGLSPLTSRPPPVYIPFHSSVSQPKSSADCVLTNETETKTANAVTRRSYINWDPYKMDAQKPNDDKMRHKSAAYPIKGRQDCGQPTDETIQRPSFENYHSQKSVNSSNNDTGTLRNEQSSRQQEKCNQTILTNETETKTAKAAARRSSYINWDPYKMDAQKPTDDTTQQKSAAHPIKDRQDCGQSSEETIQRPSFENYHSQKSVNSSINDMGELRKEQVHGQQMKSTEEAEKLSRAFVGMEIDRKSTDRFNVVLKEMAQQKLKKVPPPVRPKPKVSKYN